jgi:plasmid stability protein
MAVLHIRDVPEDLFEQLRMLAQEEQRSLSAQVIALLQQALNMETRRKQQAALLDEIRRRRFRPSAGVPDTLVFLREDRER